MSLHSAFSYCYLKATFLVPLLMAKSATIAKYARLKSLIMIMMI